MRKTGWQIQGGSQVGFIGTFSQQPDPSGAQVQQLCNLGQGRVQRPIQIDFAIERLGDLIQDSKFAISSKQNLGLGIRVSQSGTLPSMRMSVSHPRL